MTRIIESKELEGQYYLTATYNGKYAGKLVYQLFIFDAGTAVITDLEILKDLRRKGIATELLETTIEKIFTRKYIKRIWLQDGSENGATERLAKKLGFVATKQKDLPAFELLRKI